MEHILDEFDSTYLKKESYKLTIGDDAAQEDIKRAVDGVTHGMICAFAPAKPEITRTLEQFGFHFISIRSTYRYVSGEVEFVTPQGIRVEKAASGRKLKAAEVSEIAGAVFAFSRYHRDSEIEETHGKALYNQWVTNSLYNGYADAGFVAWDGDTVAGICTAKIKDKYGYIDLMSVLPAYQNKKIGKVLIGKNIAYLQSMQVRDILVITEGENIPANRFYQRSGFFLHEVQLVYHKHIT